jgi:hypothetical protein
MRGTAPLPCRSAPLLLAGLRPCHVLALHNLCKILYLNELLLHGMQDLWRS